MLKNVPLFGLGNEGKSSNVNAQKRVNLYAEIQEDNESNGLVLYPTPGLTAFTNFGALPNRGLYQSGGVMYVINANTLWEVSTTGAQTSRGTLLTGSGRVDMVDNGTQLLIVDGTYGYIYTFATNTLAQIVDADFPASTTCGFLNGYFLVQKTNSGQFFISALYDGTNWNALDFATAESAPDNLVRLFVDSGMVYLFGERTTEFWGDSGAADFPFARVGASSIEWGLAAPWSLCKFMDSMIFLRKNRLGAVQVCQLSGYQSVAVSTPEIDYLLSTYAGVSNATGFSYMVSGHPFYQINFATQNVSWLYDGLTKAWSSVSTGGARHRGEIQVNFNGESYVSDYAAGNVYLLDETSYTDNGTPIAREFVSRHNKGGDFITISQLWLEMQAATSTGAAPTVSMQISRDGGHTWSSEVWRTFGAVGEYGKRAVWNRLGRSRDWLFKFKCTDAVKTVFIAAWATHGR